MPDSSVGLTIAWEKNRLHGVDECTEGRIAICAAIEAITMDIPRLDVRDCVGGEKLMCKLSDADQKITR